jgi:hypothetical protein
VFQLDNKDDDDDMNDQELSDRQIRQMNVRTGYANVMKSSE